MLSQWLRNFKQLSLNGIGIYGDNSWLVAFTAPLDKRRCCVAAWIRVMTGKTKQSSRMREKQWEKTEPRCCCCQLFILLQTVWQGNGRPRWVTEVEISQQTPRTQISHKTSKKDWVLSAALSRRLWLPLPGFNISARRWNVFWFVQSLFFQGNKLIFVRHLHLSLIRSLPKLCVCQHTTLRHKKN